MIYDHSFFFFGGSFFLGWLARFSDDKMKGNTKSIWYSLRLNCNDLMASGLIYGLAPF